MLRWTRLNNSQVDLRILEQFLSPQDPRPAREQFDSNYPFGGWQPLNGCTFNPKNQTLNYPGDPPLKPLATVMLREEIIFLYPADFVLILQPDGSIEVARLD